MVFSLTDQDQIRTTMWKRLGDREIWSLPRRAITYLLTVELLLAGVLFWVLGNAAMPTTLDWLRAVGLIFVMLVHLVVVRRAEENRRNAAQGPHIALTSVWTFAAVVALCPVLTVAVVFLLRIVTYQISRRQPYRFFFSSVSCMLSALAASGTLKLAAILTQADLNWHSDLLFFAFVMLAAAVHGTLQAVLVGVAMKLTLPDQPFRGTLGSRDDNLLESITLCGGAVIGLLMGLHWTAPLLALFPVVAANRMLDEARQRREHLERLLREQKQAHQRLAQDAHTDYRTGLLNTNGLADSAARVTQRCRQSGQSATIVAIDLDHFKRVNDTWGHPAGNAVLAEVGRVLRDKVRPGDVAGRDGGEEFVVVLADTPLAQGVVIAERIREAIAELTVVTTDKHRSVVTLRGRNLPAAQAGGHDLRSISASIGVAVIPDNGENLALAQHAADAALYIAKENGRNQVRVAELDIGSHRLPSQRSDEPRVVTRTA